MPQLHVTKNGVHLCSVGSDDVWCFTVSLHADIWGPQRSELTITGSGKLLADGSSDFLIWHMSHKLNDCDLIQFSFEEGTTSSPMGEVFIGEPEPEGQKVDFFGPVPDDEVARLESRPQLNPNCAWRFATQSAPEIRASPDVDRQSLSLHILWNEMRPERLRVHLTKSSLREITRREGGEELFLEYVPIGTLFGVAVGV